MNKFLFITHQTPYAKQTELRKQLNVAHRNSLLNQTYKEWRALVFGAQEGEEGHFLFVKLSDADKETKFKELFALFQSREIMNVVNQFDYIVKLDDDDIISPTLLEELAELDFDCCYDEYHTFYEITSGQVTQQKRPWIASTCVHKRQHAFAQYSGKGASPVGNLLYSVHSDSWHTYYQGKNVIKRSANKPTYLRVLSPTSITANDNKNFSVIESNEHYLKYLMRFGTWGSASILGFEKSIEQLNAAWFATTNSEQKKLALAQKQSSFGTRIFAKVMVLLSRWIK